MNDTKAPREFWQDVRETVRGGIREIRNVGDELAKQGRVHVDIFQTERRLKNSYCALGEAIYRMLNEQQAVAENDPQISELSARIRYYADELGRLKSELGKTQDSAN
jgi:hypothetical protein